MILPTHIKKRNGSIDIFDSSKIRQAIFSAVREVKIENQEDTTEKIYKEVLKLISYRVANRIPEIKDIEKIVIETARNVGFNEVSEIYDKYSKERAEVRKFLEITDKSEKSVTDAALLIESDTRDSLEKWDREKIINQLKKEANLSSKYAEKIAKKVENSIVTLYKKGGIKKFNTTDIRLLVDLILREEGLELQRKKQAILGIPSRDFENIIFSRSNENSNVAVNNPEAVNLEIAERIQKSWALSNLFSEEVADAHLQGRIHLHDLGYPTRVYCSSHSLEYIKKYGLNKVLCNLESKSSAPNSAEVLNQHVQTFLASLQAEYAGALGFGFLNIFYAPLLNRPVNVCTCRLNGNQIEIEKRDLDKLIEQKAFSSVRGERNYIEIISERRELKKLSKKGFEQIAQNLIFAASQNAFSRGGQTLFIDFNLHTGVPHYMKNVPAIGPGGLYMVKMPNNEIKMIAEAPRIRLEDKKDSRNGDADSDSLTGEFSGGKILTYGDFEETVRNFAIAMMEIWRRGDKDGRPFHFPKCDLHVDKKSFEDPKQKEVLDFAIKVAAENGSVYFMMDRGEGAVLAQCCRLKERIEDPIMLKHPEKLRFCGFQNVTINLPRAACLGKDLEGTYLEIEKAMELALKAHFEKKEFIQKLLDTDGTPMRGLGIISDDGSPYIDLKKATYIIGLIGLNEAVEYLTGSQLHESEEAAKTGGKLIAYMYKKIHEFKRRTGLKFTLEETPAESTTRRLAALDKVKNPELKRVIKGTEKDPYYTNSIHYAPDAKIGIIDRIIGQSKYHQLIESGAIVHAWVGEQRPDEKTIFSMVYKTLTNTQCSQLVISPTYTECDECGNIMQGEKELCTNKNCNNSSPETVNKNTINPVTRIVGYNSRIKNWNGSQKVIYEDRKKAEKQYAGEAGLDLSWMYNPSGRKGLTVIQFAKHNCKGCESVKLIVERKIEELGLGNKVDYRLLYIDDTNNTEEITEALMYGAPMDSFPTLVIGDEKEHWMKVSNYDIENGTITEREIEEQLRKFGNVSFDSSNRINNFTDKFISNQPEVICKNDCRLF